MRRGEVARSADPRPLFCVVDRACAEAPEPGIRVGLATDIEGSAQGRSVGGGGHHRYSHRAAGTVHEPHFARKPPAGVK